MLPDQGFQNPLALLPLVMKDPLQRFTTRVDNYIKYRPGYPSEIIDLLRSECLLSEESVIADIGSGTGILSELFLNNGNRVIGIEPNAAMRGAAEQMLKSYGKFTSREGSAESTKIAPTSVNFVTAGQSFHWFDPTKARWEFTRILKPQGWVVLIWNERRLNSTPFLRAYEELLMRFGTDYAQLRQKNATELIQDFFAPEPFKVRTLENTQEFDFDGLRGRVLSSSYIPEVGAPNFEAMLVHLRKIFETHAKQGRVAIEYDTQVFFGRLPAVD